LNVEIEDMKSQLYCPFCNLDKTRIIIANDHAVAFHDGFPVTPGHSLIVPKRHITSFFEVTREWHPLFILETPPDERKD